ncbi:hypothetical protein C0989_010945, partial [Termitomyces sp. Mn162]
MTAPTTSGTWTCLVHITSLGRLVWMERSLDVHYFENMPWGYTGTQEWKSGGLFAREFDSKATKVVWDLEGIYATSRHIRGVRFAGIPHPGIIGTAPSTELLEKWNEREGKLIEDHRDAISPVAYPLNPKGVYIGQATPEKVKEKIGLEGARTLPGRDNGGNRDASFCVYGLPSPVDPQYAQQVVLEGISADVHGNGKQYSMGATIAYKQAALNAITYLGK